MSGQHRAYPDVEIQHVELREEVEGLGYVINANDVNEQVEVWIDPDHDGSRAVANIRLLPEDAIRLAEQLICAAERIVADHA